MRFLSLLPLRYRPRYIPPVKRILSVTQHMAKPFFNPCRHADPTVGRDLQPMIRRHTLRVRQIIAKASGHAIKIRTRQACRQFGSESWAGLQLLG